MIIKCWGSRGSVPISGKEYLKYGGDTTCIEIKARSGDTIIIDAGTGIRRLGNQLIRDKRRAIHMLFTHAHWDHINGFPFFSPLYSRHTQLIMHKCPLGNNDIESTLSRIMTPPFFPIQYSDLSADITYQNVFSGAFQIGSIMITTIFTSHPNGGSGYKFTEGGSAFVFLTDNELGYVHPGGLKMNDYAEFAMDTDLLIHDAEFLSEEYRIRKEWGHSVYRDALDLAVAARVNMLGLFHHNRNRTDQAVDDIVKDARRYIDTQGSDIECIGVAVDMTFEL